jgi:hypothetical protein
MTVQELIEGIQRADPLDLLIFMQWYVKRGDITCKKCIELRKSLSGNPPNCYACGLPTAKLLKQHFKGDHINAKN